MKLYKHNEIALFVSLLAMLVLMGGCVVYNADEQYTGVENKMLKEIECGQTTRDWLVETFGEPTELLMMDDGGEILRYKCVKKKDNKFVMFPPPIVIHDDEQVEHVIAFEVKDGVVQRYWKEG
ncbi:MAG: hypothetical protein ACYTEK_17100 [Planctomycetota bacterium]|jgi:hypothetical protein